MARRSVSPLLAAIVCLAGVSVSASAQDIAANSSEPPAHISFVDGPAVLERDGRTDAEPLSMPLLSGDRLRTQGGRVEVLFADGSALHLDANTVVDFQSDEVVRLLEGRIRLSIVGPARDVSYRIDAPSAWVQVNVPGEYRVSILRNADVELAVLRGAAELVNEDGRSYIRAGERTFARQGAAPTAPYVFNSAAWDSFDRWSEQRRDQRLGVSAQYLPSDVRPYAASFDTYGSWRHEQTYGYVWYPRVHVGWRPYYRGRWVSLRPYGWTWIAHDPWGWPTHHYGRWGFSAGAWFWIPGRHWGPAWVSWAYATDYVSWCPLGWNNRPVFQFINVNVYGGRRYSPWDAWTVVPRRHFGGGYVNVAHLGSVRIDQRVHNTFIVRDTPPEVRYAVGRNAAPIRSAGRFAVPRSGPATYSTDSVSGRAGERAAESSGDRRFPAPARPSRTPSAVERQAGDPIGGRAVSRERSAGNASVAPRATSPDAAASEPREYRRAPQGVTPRSSDDVANPRGVTAAPPGAVRATPRARERSESAPIDPAANSYGRTRAREERAPVYSSPAPAAPAPRASEDPGRYRATPSYRSAPDRGERAAPDAGYRSAPDAGYRNAPERGARPAPEGGYRSAPEGEPRGRAIPRNEPSAPPSYRPAPQPRQAPSGPPPAASPPEPRSPGGDRGGDRGAGSRPRGGDAQPSGQGRRRQ